MKKRIVDVSLYKPQIEDLWFREAMMADPETMSYNDAWGGIIPFSKVTWQDWYNYWIVNPNKRFYRYITTGRSRSFVGEVAYHFDEGLKLYLVDVIISAKCRRQGYGKAGLEMLCGSARKAKIPELYDNITINNPGISVLIVAFVLDGEFHVRTSRRSS